MAVLSLQGPLLRWLKVNFSEAFVAWIHIKALRVFVESVLRCVRGPSCPEGGQEGPALGHQAPAFPFPTVFLPSACPPDWFSAALLTS